MKKLIFTFFLTIAVISTASAQFTKIGGGLGFNSGFYFNNERFSDHKTGNPLIFLKGIYEVSLPFHLSPSATIYIPNVTKFQDISFSDKISITAYSVDINGHYVFNSLNSFEFYGLAGLNFLLLGRKQTFEQAGFPAEVSKESDNALGLNLGAGSYIKIRETFDIFIELKAIVSSQIQVVAFGGILFNIDWMKKNENPGI